MISPSRQKIIQIDVTNACIHKCSHCTRFCGHHRKSFFMDVPSFKNAVASLSGYPGMVGMMGGEPTLHPDFETLSLHMKEMIPNPDFTPIAEPVANFVNYRNRHLQDVDRNKRGLWTSLGKRYYDHFEVIQDVFPYQCINDHMNDGLHQALLIPRKELGVSDEEWIPLRDNCWIQNLWSAAITPKGAFFCEVAAALDMLFDGPGGWPVEPGWWKRTPADFADQLHWCELCSAPLRVPRVRAKEERDIVSPGIFKRLKALRSPKVEQGRVAVFNTAQYSAEEFTGNPSENPEWYLPDSDNSTRIAGTNAFIHPQSVVAFAAPSLDTTPVTRIDAQAFAGLQFKDWCIVVREGSSLTSDIEARIRSVVLNPGCLYYYTPLAKQPGKLAWTDNPVIDASLFFIVNRNANVLRTRATIPTAPDELAGLWPESKRIPLSDRFDVFEPTPSREIDTQKCRLMTAHLLTLWQALTGSHKRVALYGAGKHTRFLFSLIGKATLPLPILIADDSPAVESIQGIPIVQSEKLSSSDFDVIMVSSDAHATAMTNRAHSLWSGSVIVNPYAHFTDPSFVKPSAKT